MTGPKKRGASDEHGPGEETARQAKGARPAPPGERRGEPDQPRAYPDPVDDALDDTFPASDPPSWPVR